MSLSALLLALSLSLPCAAAQVEIMPALPAAPAPAPSSWAAGFGSFWNWLATPGALEQVGRVDPRLAAFDSVDPAQASGRAALGPLAATFPDAERLAGFATLPESERQALLFELSSARARAETALAADIRAVAHRADFGRMALGEYSARVAAYQDLRLYGPSVQESLRKAESVQEAMRMFQNEGLLRPFEQRGGDGVSGAEDPLPTKLQAPSSSAARRMTAPPSPKKKSNLALRAVTAAALVPSIVGITHLGGVAFTVFIVGLAGLCASEYANLMNKGGRSVSAPLAVAGAAALALFPSTLSVSALLGVAFASEVFREKRSLERAMFTAAGAALLGAGLAPLIAVRAFPHGEALALLVFVSAWFSDTTAMLVGKSFGSHKLAPVLSPNKTWEGALGGLAGALLAGLAFHFAAGLPWLAALGVSAIVGSIGQVSGLMNSMIKRLNGAKDSGTLLPGHGGFLDRFDTLLLSSAVVYALLLLLR